MPALSGVSLGGGRGSSAVLAATITGADDSQDGLATVACEVVVTDPTGAETYAWTLTDPRGVSRTALFDDATIADPVFTPDIVGGGGQWVARVTVTRGSASLVLSKIITIGQDRFVLARSIVSDETTDASVSGGNIVWGGVTFAAPNTGVAVVDGDLVLTGQASTDLGRSFSARTAALVTATLSTLCGISEIGSRQVLVILKIGSFAMSTTEEAIRVGLEQASAAIGTGSGGRGICGGQAYNTGIRQGAIVFAEGSAGSTIHASSVASIAGVACVFAGGGVDIYTATTAYTDAAAVIATTSKMFGGIRPTTRPTLDRFVMANAHPAGGAGVDCVIEELQVWVR